jgi:hypothetical protein
MLRQGPAPGTPGAGLRVLRAAPLVLGLTALALLAGRPQAPAAIAAAPAGAETAPWGGHPPFRDGPPAQVSGGFGEDTCSACHFGTAEDNDPSGSLEIGGIPAGYTPGESYLLTVSLKRHGLAAGGFQLTARFQDDGTQAGSLAAGSDAEALRLGILTDREVQYAHHLLPGIEPAGTGANSWTLRWTAPEAGRVVVFHAAAVAADGDESQFGDYVFTTSGEAGAATK